MKEIQDFLKDLEQNNTREWFDQNRDRYQKTKEIFLHLTDLFINEIRAFDPAVGHQESKNCMFRIFRDVRFSHDKRPYKSNYGSFIAKGGRKDGNPGYYIHLQPGNSFIGGGIYMPDADKLKRIRSEIFNNPDEFLEIINDPTFSETYQLSNMDKLKTAPRGFDKEREHIDLLRYKSYAAMRTVSDEKLLSPDFISNVVADYKKLYPLNRFLYSAIFND